MKPVLLVLGLLSLATGVVGIVLPLLPATPFFLLSAFLFSKSSPRFHLWMREHRYFGPILTDWESNQIIRPRAKWAATVFMTVSIGYLVLFTDRAFWLKATILTICSIVLMFIWTRRSR